jgi:hypothetical protein
MIGTIIPQIKNMNPDNKENSATSRSDNSVSYPNFGLIVNVTTTIIKTKLTILKNIPLKSRLFAFVTMGI